MAFILTSKNELEFIITKKIEPIINRKFPNVSKDLKKSLISYYNEEFENSPEYKSLTTGELQAHFGFVEGTSFYVIYRVVSTIINSISVTTTRFKRKGKRLNGGLKISIPRGYFDKLQNLPEAYVITEKGEKLPWLEWFLKRGTEIIIADYFIKLDLSGGVSGSRSGDAVMIPNEGSSWGVPEYAGTDNNNWISRTLGFTERRLDDIEFLIRRSMRKHL